MKNSIKKFLSTLGLWRISVLTFDFLSYHKSQIQFLYSIQSWEEFEFGFFFNSYATGGAEKVQLEIVRSISDHQITVLITNFCINEHYKSDFETCSNLRNIYFAVRKRDFYYPLILKNLANRINKMNQPKLMGCDCQLFYDLVPYLNPNVIIIDLFHTLVHEFEKGPEHWSLALVERINKRILISYKLKKDFEIFYSTNGVKPKLLNRLVTIHNFVNPPIELKSTPSGFSKPIALFVCRNHFVKRIQLAGKIANRLSPYMQFVFIGENLEEEVLPNDRTNIHFTGNIADPFAIARWFKSADFLMMTSSREGLPMVLLEGMSYGAIPVSTNVGAISEIIPSSEYGILVPNYSDEKELIIEFETSFINLIKDTERISIMKENVKKFVLEKFNKVSFQKSYRKELLNNV
jgi:glycosyltransferase involved in cell wall biosynthesis